VRRPDLREFLRNWKAEMQDKFRLYRRPNGMLYADEYGTRHRESLQTKNEAEARRLIAARNQAAASPVFNMEMAKVYLRAHDPLLCERTWTTVSDSVQQTCEEPTKARWENSSRVSRWSSCLARSSFRRHPRISWLS
jgi:hypothetical protein